MMSYDELIAGLRQLEKDSGKIAVINWLGVEGLSLPDSIVFYDIYIRNPLPTPKGAQGESSSRP